MRSRFALYKLRPTTEQILRRVATAWILRPDHGLEQLEGLAGG
jgi:hypothetical protein